MLNGIQKLHVSLCTQEENNLLNNVYKLTQLPNSHFLVERILQIKETYGSLSPVTISYMRSFHAKNIKMNQNLSSLTWVHHTGRPLDRHAAICGKDTKLRLMVLEEREGSTYLRMILVTTSIHQTIPKDKSDGTFMHKLVIERVTHS